MQADELSDAPTTQNKTRRNELVLEKIDIDTECINRLFENSASLDCEAIVDFVSSLVSVSLDELHPPMETMSPSLFCLSKLVEVAFFNMTRIRLVWTRIWKILSPFFQDAVCHSNAKVAMYALDSLRQISMKLLERDELSNYNFQNDFLRYRNYKPGQSRRHEDP